MDKLSENKVNSVIYFTYLREDSLIKWMKKDKYNKKVKLYKLIGKKIMDTHIKKMLDKILIEYNDIISKRSYDIKNYKLV